MVQGTELVNRNPSRLITDQLSKDTVGVGADPFDLPCKATQFARNRAGLYPRVEDRRVRNNILQ